MFTPFKNARKFDLVAYALILSLGTMEFVLSSHAASFLNDTSYVELAKSVLNRAEYGFNHKPMTQLPPGLPYLLAFLSKFFGFSYLSMVRLMTVFTTMALLISYRVLSSIQDRYVAAAFSLLLGTSPFLFQFSTTMIFADMPYFFASMLLLWLAIKLDVVKQWRLRQYVLWFAWGVILIATVLLKSVAIALLCAFCGWMGASLIYNREAGKRRLRLFCFMVLAGIVAETGWMIWSSKHQFHEWSIPGYQENYVAQLRLKNANEPELGLANWQDVAVRPFHTADDISAAMVGLFIHKEMAPAWYSPGTLVPLILIVLGLVHSFKKTGGGGLIEWYFFSYEAMFLFWPWDFEPRFFLPVSPFAFLYAWRGLSQVWLSLVDRPRLTGLLTLTLSGLGGVSSLLWGRGVLHPKVSWCLLIWGILALAAIPFVWSHPGAARRASGPLAKRLQLFGRSISLRHGFVTGAIAAACVLGLIVQLRIGIENLSPSVARNDYYPDIEAAQWVQTHSEPDSVVMARKDDLVVHYSDRRVVWFPPSRDAQILMDGIHRYGVEYVVVSYGNDTYWRPTAQECFSALKRAYPGAFQPVHEGPRYTVFEVAPELRQAWAGDATPKDSKIRLQGK